MIEATEQPPRNAVDHALDQLGGVLSQLIKLVDGGGLDDYSDLSLVAFFQSFERLRNRLSIIALPETHRPGTFRSGSPRPMTRVLAEALRISTSEAARRVRASEALVDRVSMLGEPLDPAPMDRRRATAHDQQPHPGRHLT